MNKFIYCISLLVVVFSCESKTANMGEQSYQVDFNKEITIKYSELFDAFEIVQLRPMTPIGSLDKLIYTEDHIIVVDQSTNKMIHVFSKKGDVVAEINNKGNGLGEFINQIGVRLSNNKHDIYFYCPINKKILIYSLDGEFKNEFYQKDFLSVGDMFVVDDGIVLVDFVQDDVNKRIIFLEDDFLSYQYLKYLDDGVPEFGYERGKSAYFFQGVKGFYYKDFMYNSFTYFRNDGLIHQFEFDLGDKALALKANQDYTFQELNQEMETQNAYVLGEAIVDLGDHLLMDLRQAENTRMLFTSKETQKTVLVRTLENDMDGIFKESFFPEFDSPGYFVFPIYYNFLKQLINSENNRNQKYENELAKVKDGDAEDIVLMVYKLKPNIKIDF